jgi:transposase-like protein
VEVVGRVSGRRSWSDPEKLEILAEAFRPGVRVRDAITRREVSSRLSYTWRKQARLGKLAADDQASGSTTPPATWFRFTPDRTGAHPQAHLAGFRGFLKADAYTGCEALYRGGVTEVACWAHFRRKVFDLHERSPTPLTTDILERIGTLYAVEAEVRGQPLVDALREVLDAALRRLSPKSDMAKPSHRLWHQTLAGAVPLPG